MAEIRPLREEDLPHLEQAFRSFPHKARQQKAQGLNPEKLAERFTADLRAQLAKESESGLPLVGLMEGRAVALAALREDAWHSRFYPRRFARLAPFMTHMADSELRRALIARLLGKAKSEGRGHVITRVDGSEFEALRDLTAAGFYLVDCSLKMSIPLRAAPDLAPPSAAASCVVREFRTEDLPAIRRIATTSHPMNHYYNDPLLSREGTESLFAAWVERCCVELPSRVFILERRGEVHGFSVYLKPISFNREIGVRVIILDFVCLDSSKRGGGLGRWLIAKSLGALAEEYEFCELRTSQNNYPAQDCYADLGFRVVSTDFVLHGDFEPDPNAAPI